MCLYLPNVKWHNIPITVLLEWGKFLRGMTEPNSGLSSIPGWYEIQENLNQTTFRNVFFQSYRKVTGIISGQAVQ
jgi:hypothetical protein